MAKNETIQTIKENLEHAFLKIAQHPADQILVDKHPKLQLWLLAQGFNTFTPMELRKIREYSEQDLLVSDLESNLALPSKTHPDKVLGTHEEAKHPILSSNLGRIRKSSTIERLTLFEGESLSEQQERTKEELKKAKLSIESSNIYSGPISKDQHNSITSPKELPISNSKRKFLKGLAGIGGLVAIGKSTEILANSLKDLSPKVGHKIQPVLPKIAEDFGEGLIQGAEDFKTNTGEISNSISEPFADFINRRNQTLRAEESQRLVEGIKRMNP